MNTKTRRAKRELYFKLTDSDYILKGKDAASKRAELDVIERRFEDLKKKAKSEVELKQQELNGVLSVIQQGRELREVECTELFDYERGVVSYLYDGEVLETRPMERHERQMKIEDAE